MPSIDSRPEIWLMRHGETAWTLSGAHTGRTDIPLTPAGERQAAEIGRCLAGRPFALVLTSPLGRARETCRLAGYGDVAQIDSNLREWDYGAYEGHTSAEIRKNVPDWTIWTGQVPQGETIQQVAARARQVIERALAAAAAVPDGQPADVALFAHGHLLRVLTACWLGLPPDDGRLFALEPASIGILGYERETRVITQWNFVCCGPG
ncbi:MAG: histidine phosphatase family protein [Bryobacteraceae bacterium]|jgi:broad specificity phosphatase PhoE